MDLVEDVVIVGAGIAGLTTALGLHRLGYRSLVLESWSNLRITGFAFTTWTNAWKALDAVGLGDSLRRQHGKLLGSVAFSTVSGLTTSEISFQTKATHGETEVRCVKRKVLLEALEKALPSGTIRFSSKVVSIEELGHLKLVHLADGSIIKTKVLVGCDGVNSLVAKWLGFKNPTFTGRSSIRGYTHFNNGHRFVSKFLQFFGNGLRYGFVPCDDTTVYWFFTWIPSTQEEEIEENPTKMKQFVLRKLGMVPDKFVKVVEYTDLENIIACPLRYRRPWELLWGNISKENVCIAGDALHPMTPDIGQGGCAALEDGVVLARCLGEALAAKGSTEVKGVEEYERITMGLKKYAEERRRRSIELITTAYIVGFIQQSDGKVMNLLRDKLFSSYLASSRLRIANFDCGNLLKRSI